MNTEHHDDQGKKLTGEQTDRSDEESINQRLSQEDEEGVTLKKLQRSTAQVAESVNATATSSTFHKTDLQC